MINHAEIINGVWTGALQCYGCRKPAENLYRRGSDVVVGCVSCASADRLTEYLGRVNNAESQAAVTKVSKLLAHCGV